MQHTQLIRSSFGDAWHFYGLLASFDFDMETLLIGMRADCCLKSTNAAFAITIIWSHSLFAPISFSSSPANDRKLVKGSMVTLTRSCSAGCHGSRVFLGRATPKWLDIDSSVKLLSAGLARVHLFALLYRRCISILSSRQRCSEG